MSPWIRWPRPQAASCCPVGTAKVAAKRRQLAADGLARRACPPGLPDGLARRACPTVWAALASQLKIATLDYLLAQSARE